MLSEKPPKTAYVDRYGAITQHPVHGGDEGDSAHREAFYALGCALSDYPPIKTLEEELFFPEFDGILVRHAKAKKPWIRARDRGSRDQYTPWICLAVYTGRWALFDEIDEALKQNGHVWFFNTKKNGTMFTPDKTPDLMSPKLYSIILRGRLGWLSWPFNLILDLHTLLATIHWNWFRPEEDNDNCNHLAIMAVAREKAPTPWSILSWWILDKQEAAVKLWQYWDDASKVTVKEPYKDAWWVAEPWVKYLEES